MAERATRVALLARDGQARERLADALREAGAELVAVVDPLAADLHAVSAAAPEAILVALEPAIEDALDAYASLLSDPGITVIFDEAELAAQRAGWDAARWARHLSAKLNRHDDVLPPGAEKDEIDWRPSPGPLPSPQLELSEDDFRSISDEAQRNADAVPAHEGLEAWLDRAVLAEVDPGAEAGASQDEAAVDIAAALLDGPDGGVPGAAGEAQADSDALSDLEQRISGLSLADVDSYGHGPERGAVVLEAGLGGPDAVRQLLAGLPGNFPRPVLVRMRLDGGRYDRLVKQMGRATPLVALLAQEGEDAVAGHVYFLPPELTVARDRGRLHFARDEAGARGLPQALPADDSAILFLSGSDPALVEEAMGQAWGGALVLGQSPDGSYDASAATRVIECGGSAAAPAAIAEQLLDRWPPRDRPAGEDLEEPEA